MFLGRTGGIKAGKINDQKEAMNTFVGPSYPNTVSMSLSQPFFTWVIKRERAWYLSYLCDITHVFTGYQDPPPLCVQQKEGEHGTRLGHNPILNPRRRSMGQG